MVPVYSTNIYKGNNMIQEVWLFNRCFIQQQTVQKHDMFHFLYHYLGTNYSALKAREGPNIKWKHTLYIFKDGWKA